MVILNSYLGYPDDFLANNHRKANRLGLLDLTPQERAKLVQEEDDVSPVIKENVMETRIIKTRTDVPQPLPRPAGAAATSCKRRTSATAAPTSKT